MAVLQVHSLTVLVSLLCCAAIAEAGPSHKEWKEKQAAKAAAADAAAARQSKMAAVEKVVSMLEALKAQVLSDGENEASTYNKFACFCKDTMAKKSDAITTGDDEKTTLSAKIEGLANERDGLDTTISGLEEDIQTEKDAMNVSRTERKKTLVKYEADAADLKAAIYAIEGAIKSLKASKRPSFAQFQAVSKTVREAALLADALGLSGTSTQRTLALFQDAPSVPIAAYKFRSESIIETLEGLRADFSTNKADLDKEEVKSVAEYDQLMQLKSDTIKRKTRELEAATKSKAQKQDDLASTSQELSTVSATLLDDQEYLQELAKMCSDRAKTWDQRTEARQNEITAIVSALDVIQGAVSNKTSAATIRFTQSGLSLRLAKFVASDEDSMEAVEASVESNEDSRPAAFLQRSSRSHLLLARRHAAAGEPLEEGARREIITLLRGRGRELNSAALTSLASELASDKEDAFAKIKTLIEELITRMEKEAAGEADQKAWCDKSMSEANLKRDEAADDIKELNSQMARQESLRDKLDQEVTVLGEEISELNTSRTEAESIREAETEENKNTVDEAKAGVTAVNDAIDILEKYYKEAAKEEVDLSLAQRGPSDDAPGSGFKAGEAYKGAQGEAGGIIGMLEVVRGDFERTVSETEAAEAKAKADHKDFMAETGKSLGEKETAEKEKKRQKDDAESKLSEDGDTLKDKTDLLKTAVKELLELKPACVDTGMSYEERVARREDEIESLKKALCILENYAQYGPGVGSEGC